MRLCLTENDCKHERRRHLVLFLDTCLYRMCQKPMTCRGCFEVAFRELTAHHQTAFNIKYFLTTSIPPNFHRNSPQHGRRCSLGLRKRCDLPHPPPDGVKGRHLCPQSVPPSLPFARATRSVCPDGALRHLDSVLRALEFAYCRSKTIGWWRPGGCQHLLPDDPSWWPHWLYPCPSISENGNTKGRILARIHEDLSLRCDA